MANLSEISKCLFMASERSKYKYITQEDKEKNFFIINRYLSKKYPRIAQHFNFKNMDKALAMDLLFIEISSNPELKREVGSKGAPFWLWSKSKKKEEIKENNFTLSEKEQKLLMEAFDLRKEDLQMLMILFPDDLKEELQYLKDLQDQEIKNNIK